MTQTENSDLLLLDTIITINSHNNATVKHPMARKGDKGREEGLPF